MNNYSKHRSSKELMTTYKKVDGFTLVELLAAVCYCNFDHNALPLYQSDEENRTKYQLYWCRLLRTVNDEFSTHRHWADLNTCHPLTINGT